MATSAASQNHAQLIREMSREMNRTRYSSASSKNSQSDGSPQPTISDFDPENEAIMSTRQLDNYAQKLPELRASAQKYSRFARPESGLEPDFAINTSAIGRAFPDFSQGGTSSDDDSHSIEIGRGGRKESHGTIGKLGRSREYSSNAQLSLDEDSMDLSAPLIDNYEVTATPPLTRRKAPEKGKEAARGSLRRDARVRQASGLRNELLDQSPPPAKTKDYGSGESRKGSDGTRRTLASMHARVRDENEVSRISDERPPTIDLTARNTRFGNVKNQQAVTKGSLPTRFSSTQGLLNTVSSKKEQQLNTSSTPNQATVQSFMLPDLPNISELVSGVFEDGTPVFSRHGKPRASRFVSGSQNDPKKGSGYAGIGEIPIPTDEQAIFMSLKLLQDKVAVLEKTNAEAENTIQDLQRKNQVLETDKSDRRRAQRSDSALGMTDSDGTHEASSGQRKQLIEKNRLESAVRSLQSQVDASSRKAATAQTILKSITRERDLAVSQLGLAYVTIEQLKTENEDLKAENAELKTRKEEANSNHQHKAQRRTTYEDVSRQKPDRKVKALKNTVKEANRSEDSQHAKGTTSGQACASHEADAIFDLQIQGDRPADKSNKKQQHAQPSEIQDSEDSGSEITNDRGKSRSLPMGPLFVSNAHQDEASRNLTYLSFVDGDEIAQLRKTLEQERVERKQRQALKSQANKNDIVETQDVNTFTKSEMQHPQQVIPRKSSMKNLTARSNKRDATEPLFHPQNPADTNRRHSEGSMLSTRSRRRDLNVENITSAFIVPDITFRNLDPSSYHVPELTEEAQRIVSNLAKHDGQNCTVCKQTISRGEHHDHTDRAEATIKIPKPVPVSERMPEATQEEGDPTVRPSQAPRLALATVLKELEDELDHLKIQLTQYQKLYNGHDPALSKRRRKSVYQRMENLLQAIDLKSDQIYSLYDVLEGQKQDGHEISDEEVEITLQSIGIKAPELHLRGGSGDEDLTEKPVERQPWDLESDADSSDALPWEGIDSTGETTKSGFLRTARRRSSAVHE